MRDKQGLKSENQSGLSYPSPGIKVSNPSGLRSVIKLPQELSLCPRSYLSWRQGDHGALDKCLCVHADEDIWVHVLTYPCTERNHSEPSVGPMHSEGRGHMYEYACAPTTHV